MSSRSDMSDSQDRASNGSAFRDNRDDVDVVDQMYDTADQMGEDMPIGLDRNFEYRRIGGGARSVPTRVKEVVRLKTWKKSRWP